MSAADFLLDVAVYLVGASVVIVLLSWLYPDLHGDDDE